MIINFSVQNFASIKDKQTLSFEADRSTHLEDYYIIHSHGLRLLKLGLIYGANASGKTGVLKALNFLRVLILEPESQKNTHLDFNPFLFDAETPHLPSALSIDFFHNNIRYFYEVEFNKHAILKEELKQISPSKSSVFKRSTDLENQFSEIKFGSKISLDKSFKKTLESNTLWNNTVLGGFLKTNIEIKELQEVTNWFEKYLTPMIFTDSQLETYVTSQIESSFLNKKDVLSFLKKADFKISDIIIDRKEEDVPEDFFDFLENKVKISTEKVNAFKKLKGKLTSINIELEHSVGNKKYKLPFRLESQGTQRFYGFAGLLSLLIRESISFSIDELESSLHPELFTHFLLSFLINSKNSQLIATTHNREILNNKDIFRNDAIWFTDKNANGATELYSLGDFDTSVIRDTSNILNAYKTGKLGGVPILGDYFVDINNEN